MNAQRERRLSLRSRGDMEWLFVIQIENGKDSVITETKDISCSGIRCKMDSYCCKGSIVNVTLLLPLTEKGLIFEKIKCKGKTARCELFIDRDSKECYDIAFKFLDLQKKDKNKIAKYVKHVQEL